MREEDPPAPEWGYIAAFLLGLLAPTIMSWLFGTMPGGQQVSEAFTMLLTLVPLTMAMFMMYMMFSAMREMAELL
jgi:hypothetical protein